MQTCNVLPIRMLFEKQGKMATTTTANDGRNSSSTHTGTAPLPTIDPTRGTPNNKMHSNSETHTNASNKDGNMINGSISRDTTVHNNSTTTIHAIHNHYAGSLDSSATPSTATGNAGGLQSQQPTNLSGAKRQIRALVVPKPEAAPNPKNRPRSSSHQPPGNSRNCNCRIVLGTVVTWTLILKAFAVCPLIAIMLIFTAGIGSTEQTQNIRHGFFKSWIDHSSPGIWQRRVTVSDYQAKWIAGFAIVIVALSVPPAYILGLRIAARICTRFNSFSQREIPPQAIPNNPHLVLTGDEDIEGNDDNEEAPLLDRGRNLRKTHDLLPRIHHICRSSTSLHTLIVDFTTLVNRQKISQEKHSSWKNYSSFLGRALVAYFFSLLAIAIFFGYMILAIKSANIMTDSVVLSEHPNCGFWVRNPDIVKPSLTGCNYLQEVESLDYSKKCYHGDFETGGCNVYVSRSIYYDKHHNRQCPFEEGFCLDGKSSAYTLQTGPVSSKVFGINVEVGYTFNRITTCSPIRRQATLSQDGKFYQYDYGISLEYGNFTWASPAETAWQFSGYNVATFYYEKNSSNHSWTPSSDFKPETNDAITLLLIQSQKNYHTTPQHDPIFPAKHSVTPFPGQGPLYFNNDPIATALACVDTTEICDASGKICYQNFLKPDPELQDLNEKIGYYMLYISLMESTIINAIKLLGGRALVAEAKLERQVSLPLAEEQWKVEAENLFESTLVRPQIALRDYMRGVAAGDPEYTDRTMAGLEGMCHTFKFRGQGWKNVTVWGMVLLILIVAVIYALSVEVEGPLQLVHRDDEESARREEDWEACEECRLRDCQHRILVGEWIFDSIFGTAQALTENGIVENGAVENRAVEIEPLQNGNLEAVSQDGEYLRRTSPRICVSGPSQEPILERHDAPTGSDRGTEREDSNPHIVENNGRPHNNNSTPT